ncbi:phage tail protein [Lysinibacillus sphaericus]|uniref:prophage endopeptidase tail family protein n=1 Tax=Lysinibacillus sphaericus TaxID=1421 RepID=UPI003CFFC81B
MLIVTNGSRTEPLLETNYEKFEELNGALRISFSSFLHEKNPGHELLDFETLIEDEDGHEYVVKDFSGDTFTKKATAVHSYFSLADDFKYGIHGGTRTLNDFMSFVLDGTGWTFMNVDVEGYQLLPNFGEANPIVLIEHLCSVFECERQILPNKVIRFAKKTGVDNDLQFRYRHNIETLSYSIPSAGLKTQIRGYGANGIDITYTSPLASSPRIGIRIADPIHDENIETVEDMTTRLASELPAAPETSIKVKVTTVDGNVGDMVWLIHEDLQLEYQTRIISKKTKRDYSESEVDVGNTQAKTIVDALLNQRATINANDKRYRSKFEQTEDRIDLEVEEIGVSIAAINIRADSITQSVTDLNNNLSSRITQTAAEIRSEVSAQVVTINNDIRTVRNDVSVVSQTASQIQSTVTSQQTQISGIGTRVSNAESSITQQANQISQKVSTMDYTGNKIASLINQTSTTISIQASKVNLIGAVNVLSDITGNLGSIHTGTLNSVNIYSANINISDDVQIGKVLRIGSHYSDHEPKMISFGGATGGVIRHIYDTLVLGALNGVRTDGDLIVDGNYGNVAKTDTSGLGFGLSTATNPKRLYVRLFGEDQGYLELK